LTLTLSQALRILPLASMIKVELRLNYIKEKCGGSLKGKKILDVGCGGGILAESLALEGAIVTGIDMAGFCITVKGGEK
jgi:2-polyprenyl-3-methyl-5-hydroxy-6-metoxy-1,4-benzoquinol methylase